ncbi:MAG: thiolase family protein [Acidobacteria bacterium]|nr:MAG: thiolase family protein [Acidobacteriota bacterium]REK05631.1 MAG: thiolase family protein [Acidobacteriota bacterium]
MSEIVILGTARTAIGSFQGALQAVPAPRLGAVALRAAIERSGVEGAAIDQVNMGCVLPAGLGQAPARQAALGAGCPQSTGAVTINKVCGSGMRAVMMAANDLRAGDYELVAAGGMESMSNAPYLVDGARGGLRLGHRQLTDSMIHDGLWDPYGDQHMGNCAELCAREFSFSREQQDEYAVSSYERARSATESGLFAGEIVPVEVKGRKETIQVARDEDPFRVDLARTGSLRPAFEKDGSVTAANASNLNDGAAALVLTRDEVARRRGLEPRARLVAHASVAQAPEWFTTAPIAAVQRALERAGWTPDDVDLWEINEAFAVVVLACMQEVGIARERVNVHGGAVALGHPIGASGARIVVTLLHALEQRDARRGCAAICIGGGEATAVLVERC